MSASPAIPATTFNPASDFTYTKPRINKAGGKAIGIVNTSTNRQLLLTTPLMLTWGLNKRTDEESGRVSYDMSLQFPNDKYPDEQASAFLAKMEEFEEQIKADAIKNSKAWLNQNKLSSEGVNLLFNNMLYRPRDKETGDLIPGRAPTLRVKVDCYDDVFKCEIFDMEQKPVFPNPDDESVTPEDLITKGSHVACVLKCGGLYFVNGKFGVTWRLAQAVVKPQASLRGQCLIQLSAAEKERMEKANEESDDEGESVSIVPDSTPTTEVRAAVESVQEAEAPKKKKVVRRVKAAP